MRVLGVWSMYGLAGYTNALQAAAVCVCVAWGVRVRWFRVARWPGPRARAVAGTPWAERAVARWARRPGVHGRGVGERKDLTMAHGKDKRKTQRRERGAVACRARGPVPSRVPVVTI